MPIPFANELGGSAVESEHDLLQFSVFALPHLKTVLKEFPDVSVGGPGSGKRFAGANNVCHPGKDKDAAGLAILVVAEQIPLSGNTREMPRLNQPPFVRFRVQLLILKPHEPFVVD